MGKRGANTLRELGRATDGRFRVFSLQWIGEAQTRSPRRLQTMLKQTHNEEAASPARHET